MLHWQMKRVLAWRGLTLFYRVLELLFLFMIKIIYYNK